jgi:hypothetical protein
MGDHLKKTLVANMEPDKAKISGCILAVNNDVLDKIPHEYVTSAFASLNTLLNGSGTLHKGIYPESFKKGKKTQMSSAAYGYVIFGGMPASQTMMEKLFDNSGDYFQEYSSYETWRSSY